MRFQQFVWGVINRNTVQKYLNTFFLYRDTPISYFTNTTPMLSLQDVPKYQIFTTEL